MILENGKAPGSARHFSDQCGGAILAKGAGTTLMVLNSVLRNNSVANLNSSDIAGGAITGKGGAILHMEDELAGGSAEENFIIKNSTFSGNQTFSQGGAVWTLIEGNITIENSTFVNNRALDTATGMGGGLALSRGNTHVSSCTFAENYAWFHGGGIQASNSADVTLSNTLFYRNESERDWGNYAMNRSADAGGGGNLQFPGVRFNQTKTPADNKVTPSVIIADPLLGALSDNGGPTLTMALGEGSPALDAGANCPAADLLRQKSG